MCYFESLKNYFALTTGLIIQISFLANLLFPSGFSLYKDLSYCFLPVVVSDVLCRQQMVVVQKICLHEPTLIHAIATHNTLPHFFSITDIIMEDAPTTPTLALPATTPACPSGSRTPPANIAVAPPPPPLASPQAAAQPERDSRRSGSMGGRMGLTKEVLSAHTQQEEQAFLDRFKDLSKLRVFDQTTSSTLRCHTPTANPLSRG